MRSPFISPSAVRRIAPLLLLAVLVAILISPAAAQATDTTTAPAGPVATSPTTTAAGTAQTADGILPPASGFTALNPGVKVDQMQIQVMPELDQPAVLVIMSLTLPDSVALPATFKFTVPAGATVTGIGEVDPQGKFTYNYQFPPTETGAEWDTVTIQVKQYRSLQIDYYYDPGLPKAAGDRTIPIWFQVPTDVGMLLLHIQHPARSEDFKVVPGVQASGDGGDGFVYSVGSYTDVKAGSTLGHVVTYSKPDGDLSLNSDGSIATKSATQADTTMVLLVVILAVVVVVGGIVVWKIFTGGSKQPPKGGNGARKGGSSQAKPKQQPAGKQKAPGAKMTNNNASAKREKPARPAEPYFAPVEFEEDAFSAAPEPGYMAPAGEYGTEYCVACGEPLVPGKAFCANCGEARPS